MISEWNYHRQIVFIPSLIYWLEKYISICTNKFTCPEFFFFPVNPNTKGTYYHTIYCGESGTIHSWNIFEERDHPIAMCRAEFNTSSNLKTGGLFFWLDRYLQNTGNAVITDRGLCVQKGILEMSNRFFYGSELIKKRWYRSRGFMEMELMSILVFKIGDRECLIGEWDNTEFNILVVKEPD